jgi:hypothetical protein
VGRPAIWVIELFIRPGTCSVTGVWFILVWRGEGRVGKGVLVDTEHAVRDWKSKNKQHSAQHMLPLVSI